MKRPRSFFIGSDARDSACELCTNQVGARRTARRVFTVTGDAMPVRIRRNTEPRPLRRTAQAASSWASSPATTIASLMNSRSAAASRKPSENHASRSSTDSCSSTSHAAATSDPGGHAIATVTPRAASAFPTSRYTRASPSHFGAG